MDLNTPDYSEEKGHGAIEREDTHLLPAARLHTSKGVIDKATSSQMDDGELAAFESQNTARVPAIEDNETDDAPAIDRAMTTPLKSPQPSVLESMKRARNNGNPDPVRAAPLRKRHTLAADQQEPVTSIIPATPRPGVSDNGNAAREREVELPTMPMPATPHPARQPKTAISRGAALLGILFLSILAFNAFNAGNAQFIGSQGWAYVLGGSNTTTGVNPITAANSKLHHKPKPGATATATPQITPAQYIDEIIQNMTLDQKIGQMMIVQFVGATYGPDISTMISQYNVGAVLLFTNNGNVQNKTQLTGLIQQMKQNSPIPLAVAIDQEGGYVDRLVNLDGARPSAASIGATNDPSKAQAEGVRDASDLASYGFNMNLAPVVDVNTVYNPQLYDRTFGNNPAIVTRMAEAYLRGLQQSGKVFGTLKHFPGLGDVATDPHLGVPDVYRSKSQLEAIDWAPYRAMIQQGNVYSIMVTHDILHSIDGSVPSTLSYKVVTGILRDELGFQGVIMTDSLTMEGMTAFYPESQSAALAVEAGCDLLMGAATPQVLASMIQGIKQAVQSGAISMQRIDESVRRILTLKYELGLLKIPTN